MSKEDVAFPIVDMVESELPSERHRIEDHDNLARNTLDRITRMAIFGVCGWSLIETPLEIGVLNSNTWILALAVSKLIVILTGAVAIARVLNGLRVSRLQFVR